jgi:hypothetical protein
MPPVKLTGGPKNSLKLLQLLSLNTERAHNKEHVWFWGCYPKGKTRSGKNLRNLRYLTSFSLYTEVNA